jgi:stringent starvation protein B
VIVPAKYASDPELRLRIARELDPPVPDLVIDDRGVSASLQFDGQPFHCTVPWFALYGVQLEVLEAGQFWREDVPNLTVP